MPYKDPEMKKAHDCAYHKINLEKRHAGNKVWLAKHAEKVRVRRQAHLNEYHIATLARRKRNRAAWMQILNLAGKDRCLKCGYNKCFAAIDFHHRDPKQSNTKTPGKMFIEPVTAQRLAELEKCDALCANCHRELHLGGMS